MSIDISIPMDNVPPPEDKYVCTSCGYGTSKKSSWIKHTQTSKHLKRKVNRADDKPVTFSCVCGKTYSHHQSYYRHIKDCAAYRKSKEPPKPNPSDQEIARLLARLKANLEKSNHYIRLLIDTMEEDK